MAEGSRRIDRVLDEDYLDRIGELPLAELRELRAEAEQEAVDLSYLRRLVQGRIDVIRAETARRAGGETGAGLVDDLAKILAGEERPPPRGMGRHSTVEPSRVDEHRRWVEALVADVDLSDVAARTDAELDEALSRLATAENDVNGKRRAVHEVLDSCTAEITRRYRDGEADVDDLLVRP